MSKSHFILLILVVLSAEIFGFSAHRRVRRNDVKVLSVKTLADGTKFERIQESGTLPSLPIDEEIDDINDSRIGHIDDYGDVLVPVDENGHILPGYEYLLQPIVVEVSVDEKDAPKIPDQNRNSQLPQLPGNQDRVLEPSDEFGVGQEDENVPKVPALPPSDYTDSGESDENLKVDENEIDIPKNAVPVLIPAKEIDPIPVPVETIISEEEDQDQEEKVQNIPEFQSEAEAEVGEDFSEDAIEQIAAEFGPQVFANLVNKSSEFWAAQKMAENVETPWRIQPQDVAAEKSRTQDEVEKTEGEERGEDSGSSESEEVEKVEEDKGGSEGYILERPDSEEIEIGGAQDNNGDDSNVGVLKDIVRGGVGPIPDSSKNWELSKILLTFVLLYIFW